MAVRVTTDIRPIEARGRRALLATADAVGKRAELLIRARTWAWPGTTNRVNGEVAGPRRNIVDTGTLARSQQAPRLTGPLNAQITWTAAYAAATFLGAVFRKRRYSLPARNAPAQALRSVNLAQEFARAYRQDP
ncbi:hypothetical protein GCM10008959_25190 [Deinococcus seoulensis]|uniref:HK97 gp10 family phage protein n=1 Tax=Deinococcus seoulensis TaxID=1837379 RepID=A0ABQ2RUX9_9DEIO|nr:hypothetical protein [Deinococcus seoulensis]GGR62204.1 hypothetical protein GCM10008959_25190 [Deinococcus seoulensis]